METVAAPTIGANSEVGTLRTVIVHRPDLAHERLSPTNSHELLFDDVIWVRRAQQEFDAFVEVMRGRGTEVLLFHDLLTETLQHDDAREWVLSRRLRPEEVTTLFAREMTAWMTGMPAGELATRLTGGITVQELPLVARVIGGEIRAGKVAGATAAPPAGAGASASAARTTKAATSITPATMPAVVRTSLNPNSPIQTVSR